MQDGDQRRAVRLEDYAPPSYLTERVDLGFVLDPSRTLVTARQTIRRREGGAGDAPLVLYGDGLDTVSLAIDGEPVAEGRVRVDGGEMRIGGCPDAFVLEVVTRIDPAGNTALMGLYLSNGVFCTQCEAEGFRRVTWFQDRPDVMARYTVRIEADKARCPVLLSNGNPVGGGDLDGGRHYALWEDPFPKPSYLFALVAGDLAVIEDAFTTRSGREVALRLYSEPANIGQCRFALDSLKRAMEWDEEAYGLEYDLDLFMIVAVSDFNMGAMENKGLNVFNTSATLASMETATDADFLQVERIVAHEYFHNWTGNRVTCRDWFQLTLKEGLTVFRDQQFTADRHSPPVRRIADVTLLKEGQFVEDAGPLAHPIRPASYIEINNFYTRTVYEKGAEVIRMIRTLIGAEAYRRGIDLYFARHDGQAVTCEDFVGAMADASGRDLAPFMRWYTQAGTPEVTVRPTFDAKAGTYTLDMEQRTPPTPGQAEKGPVPIPIRMGLVDRATGEALPLRLEGENAAPATERVLELTEARQRFVFEGIEAPPVPSLLRGFSAPVRLDVPLERPDLAFLLANDEDAFNRWDAGQRLALDVMGELLAQHRGGRPLVVDGRFASALADVLKGGATDPAFTARALTLPSRGLFAQGLPEIDVDGVHAVATHLAAHLGRALYRDWWGAYDAMQGGDGAANDAAAMARRALKNTALAYMMQGDPEGTSGLAEDQYRSAANMTDRLAALRAFCDTGAGGMDGLLEDFYAAWKDEPLVVNKWLALQAGIEDGKALERVERLMAHPAFKRSNPNRVRALVGVFAMTNMTGFHRKDGAGYRFLADLVLDLDRRNPQVASRLLAPFGRWRRYDAGRQDLMRGELERVLAAQGLSGDSYEIASKSLA